MDDRLDGKWGEAMSSGFPGKMNKCYCLLARENPCTKVTRKGWLYSYWNSKKKDNKSKGYTWPATDNCSHVNNINYLLFASSPTPPF